MCGHTKCCVDWNAYNDVVSGPEALSYGEAAETIGAAVGKEVADEPAEPEAFRDDLVAERGLPQWRAEELAFIASAYGGA